MDLGCLVNRQFYVTEDILSPFSTVDSILKGTMVVKARQEAAWSLPQCPFSQGGSIKNLGRYACRVYE